MRKCKRAVKHKEEESAIYAQFSIRRKNKEIHWNILYANFDSLLSFSRIYCVPYLKSSIRQVSWNIIDFFINTSLVFFSSSKWQSNSHKTGSKSHDTLHGPQTSRDRQTLPNHAMLADVFCIRQRAKQCSTWVTVHKKTKCKRLHSQAWRITRVSDGVLQDDVFVCCLCKANKTDKWSPSDKVDDDVNF